MSLPSNSAEQNVVEQNLNAACSKKENEAQSTTLTDDITQTLDWTDEEYKNKLKMRATINSPLTKKWIKKIPTKIKINLSAQEKLDVFKYLNFSQLISFQKTNYYFNNFITQYKNELARDYFNIKIIDKLAMKQSKSGLPQNSLLQVPDPNRPGQALKYKKIDIKVKSYEFLLNDDLKKKWELAVTERIPLFLSFNNSCEAYILLDKLYPTNEETAKGKCNLILKFPLFPKNIKEMCIIRYWLERLFRCGYERAEFENIIFNPVLIKLLFENEVKKLYTKQTTLRYCLSKFESEGMKFVKDHLKIFDKFCVEFTLYNEDSDFDGIILEILNEGARFPHVCITNHLDLSIVELIKKVRRYIKIIFPNPSKIKKKY
uniref:Uncharacterized protein n=1 Tax=Meloidogyne enterolobii TaxID=390850 RepID=A0A6V7X9B3_MELEN|nr:unnamed protein product [Meloidogyne enterolobii]